MNNLLEMTPAMLVADKRLVSLKHKEVYVSIRNKTMNT